MGGGRADTIKGTGGIGISIFGRGIYLPYFPYIATYSPLLLGRIRGDVFFLSSYGFLGPVGVFTLLEFLG